MSDGPKVYPPWESKRSPCEFPDSDDRVIHAVRAMSTGKASEAQQLMFWHWLTYVTGVDEPPYRPGGLEGDRDTAFASGKAFVWFQVRALLHPEALTRYAAREAVKAKMAAAERAKKQLTRNA